MFIEELNFISLGKFSQMVSARYKKLRWPVAVLQRGMSSLFSLRDERPLFVPLLMNLELGLVGAIPFTHLKRLISTQYYYYGKSLAIVAIPRKQLSSGRSYGSNTVEYFPIGLYRYVQPQGHDF